MTHKMFWGLGALIAFVIAAGGFMYWQWSTVQQLQKQAAQFEEMIQKEKKPVAANEPPPAAPGKKWVPHGDHFHEVPIDAPDVWQGEPHEPIVQPTQIAERPKYTGELTYEAYEKYVTEAFQNIKRNEFGLPISPLPAAPPAFQNPEEEGKADRLWNKLSAEYDKSVTAAAIRMEARHVAPEYTGELTYEAYHKYLAKRKKLKEANNE